MYTYLTKNPNFSPYYLPSDGKQSTGIATYLESGQYSDKSIQKAEEFITNCIHLMGENPFLWVSFQTNPLLNFTRNLGSFESEFEKLTKTLGRLGFHIAELLKHEEF